MIAFPDIVSTPTILGSAGTFAPSVRDAVELPVRARVRVGHARVRAQPNPFGEFTSIAVVTAATGERHMAGKCDICGKTKSFGHNVSHSKRRTNREFRPNVQRRKVTVDGEITSIKVCTRCMRTALKAGR
jgi:large subunit ribosomal protein L28